MKHWRTLGGVLVVVATSACAFKDQAAKYAQTEIVAMDAVHPAATVAYQMCHEGAVYPYFDYLITEEIARIDRERHSQPPAPPPRQWAVWYCTAGVDEHQASVATPSVPAWCTASGVPKDAVPAPGVAPWVQFCDDLGRTGRVFSSAILSLRLYALAMDGVAEGKPVDASSINTLSGGVNTAVSALTTNTKVTNVAKGIGGIVAGLYPALVETATQGKLKDLVKQGGPAVLALTKGLIEYVDALQGELGELSRRRHDVLERAQTIRARVNGEGLAATDLLNQYELAADRGDEFLQLGEKLRAYRNLLVATQHAHEALAAADDTGRDAVLQAFADQTRDLVTSTISVVSVLPLALSAPAPAPAPAPKPAEPR